MSGFPVSSMMMHTSFADMGWGDDLSKSGVALEPVHGMKRKKRPPKDAQAGEHVPKVKKEKKLSGEQRVEDSNVGGVKRRKEEDNGVRSGKKQEIFKSEKGTGKPGNVPNKSTGPTSKTDTDGAKRGRTPQKGDDSMANALPVGSKTKPGAAQKPAGVFHSKPVPAQRQAAASPPPMPGKQAPAQRVGAGHRMGQATEAPAPLSKRAQKRLAKDAAALKAIQDEACPTLPGSKGNAQGPKIDTCRAATSSSSAQARLREDRPIGAPAQGQPGRAGPEGSAAGTGPVPAPLVPSASPAAPIPGKKKGRASVLEQMKARLTGGRFRWINEVLYTHTGDEALAMMLSDASTFDAYHTGYQRQMDSWPVLPVDEVARWLRERPPGLVVADFGCGDARLRDAVPNTVHSLDLVAHKPGVIACNMAHTPLADASVDVAVFCLSLMGTDYGSFLMEARRVLVPRGWLLVAEVRSRFEDATEGEASLLPPFLSSLRALGFHLRRKDASNKMFMLLELQLGATKPGFDESELGWPQLKPCIYKRR
eukprot:jgi/Mesvir1/24190/Mv10905-RA.1